MAIAGHDGLSTSRNCASQDGIVIGIFGYDRCDCCRFDQQSQGSIAQNQSARGNACQGQTLSKLGTLKDLVDFGKESGACVQLEPAFTSRIEHAARVPMPQ
jgi:hypothetical protein